MPEPHDLSTIRHSAIVEVCSVYVLHLSSSVLALPTMVSLFVL